MTRRLTLLLLGLVLALTGCSAGPADLAGLSSATPDPAALIDPDDMERPTPGVVEVDGDDPLSGLARDGFLAAAPSGDVTVAQDTHDDDRAFERLCLGEIDVVASTRAISAAESAACRANGLDVVPFRVAADATVVAVGSGAEVGTDCLSTDQVRDAFEGSVGTWADLDPSLDQVPLRTATEPSEAANLDLVAGSPTDRERALALPALRGEWDRAVVNFKAQRRWFRTAEEELTFARAERQRGIQQDRTPAERASDDAEVLRAEAELGRARTAWLSSKTELGGLEPRIADAETAEATLARSRGTLGRFSAGYAREAGDLLQPFAIAAGDDCVLPTDDAVTSGDYPLAEQLLVTVTSRSLARPEVEAFVRFQLGAARDLAEQAGVVPLPADVLTEQVGWLDDGELPDDSEAPEPERPAQ